ncbi:hypothetical protein A2U01_0032181, partial [Trifolium medium]|nr:hypothetical protein [Trifolium medium]
WKAIFIVFNQAWAFPSCGIAGHRAAMASGICHRVAMIPSWHDTAVFLLNK